MRIGLLTTSFPRYEGDTAGHFVRGFADALAQRGHAVEVLAPEPADGTRPHFPGLELRWVPYLRPRRLARTFYGAGVPDNLGHDPAAWLGLVPSVAALAAAAYRHAGDWDAVVSHWALPCGLIGSQLRGLRHLCVVHSADMWLLDRLPGRRLLAGQLAAEPTRMWFVAPHLRTQFEALLPEGVVLDDAHVGPMGFTPASTPVRERRQTQTLEVLSLGRLVRIKGLDVLIQAVASMPGIGLTIAGDGPERQALERLANALDAPVEFVGHVSGAGKRRLLARADVLALPSRPLPSGRSEGAPTSVIEAMASGLPVVATDTGGVTSLVVDGTHGRVVPPGDAGALGAALAQLRDDPELRRCLGRRAASDAAAFAWPLLAERAEAMLTR